VSDTVPPSTPLRPRAYEHLVAAAETDRQSLVVRLAGEAGLRPVEIVAVKPGHVDSRRGTDAIHAFLRVVADDAGRLAHLPGDLDDAIQRYATATECAPEEPLFSISPRRVQMIVSDVADNAATTLAAPSLGDVSTRDLRRYHARTLLGSGIHPRTVLELTAWSRLDTLAEPAQPPDDASIVDAIEAAAESTGAIAGRDEPDMAHREERITPLIDQVVDLGVSLSRASTREAIEQDACDSLGEAFEYAWIARDAGNDRMALQAAAFAESAEVDEPPDTPPGAVCRAVLDGGEPSVVAGSTAPFGGAAGSVARAVVPIEHADTSYGVLEVGMAGAPEAVTDRQRRVLRDLGRRLGQAIAAVERRRLLLADTVVRLSFRCSDERAVLVRLSGALDCSFTLTGLVPSEDGALLAFLWLEDARPDDVFARATSTDAVDSARLIRSGEDGALIEFVLTTDSPALTLVECGGSLTELTAAGGRGRLTAEFVPDVDVREVVESVESAFPDSEMVSKREVERSVQTDTEFSQTLDDTLTDKQRSALRAAHLSGYFDWPRGSTAEELAESLGVTSPTFHSHLRRAQRKLLSTYLEDGEP